MRLLLIAGLLLAATAWSADQKEAASTVVPRGIPNGGKARLPQMGPPLSNPGSPVARLYRASPEERDRALEKLPLKMQEQFRQHLERFDRMPKGQQEILIRRAETFASLSPEQKANFTRQMLALREIPEDRRRAIGMALRRMQNRSAEERQKMIEQFSEDEQKIITGLSEVMNPPDR